MTYDPTVFVTDTIHEVQKTLIEAFVLVVIVVFLFLGSVRATLIPMFAVPVSLIGAFIVLKAVGYSANTVSLLAVVLAIGIVVDDAIVVVENVERVMEENPDLSAAEATKRAMAEITAPIIAITLVLLSVFVPVAFIPGISGELFRQFAVTVAAAMLLSAINALTLSPALCAILLKRHHGPRRGVMGVVMRSIDYVRDRYGDVTARLVRISVIGLVMVAASAVGVFGLSKITPTGFLPEDDQGAFFVVVQTPGGASVGRTTDVIVKAEALVREEEAVQDMTSVIGLNFIDNYSQSNAAFMVVTLKPFEERKGAGQSAKDVIARLGQKFKQIPEGMVVPLAPPPVIGLGTGGGFAYVLQDLQGGDAQAFAQVLRGLLVAANQDPKLNRVFSTFSATNPSIALDINRDKAQILGVPLNSVFQALQASLGGYFVNNMNLFGRTWQVQVQAEAADRASIDDIYRINVRSADGKMIPLRSLVEVRVVVGPPALIRYNNRRAVTVQGGPAAGVSSGEALQAMEACRREDLAGGLRRRVDRYGVPGKARRGQDRNHSRLRGAVRLSLPCGALRKLDNPGPGAALGHGRHPRVLRGHGHGRADPRSLCPDRHDRADRPRGEKRHPHRGIRQAEAGAWRVDPRCGHRRRARAFPSGDDDLLRLHSRIISAGRRHWRVPTGAPRRRHAGVWRHDLRLVPRYFCDPAALCRLPGDSRKAAAGRAAGDGCGDARQTALSSGRQAIWSKNAILGQAIEMRGQKTRRANG